MSYVKQKVPYSYRLTQTVTAWQPDGEDPMPHWWNDDEAHEAYDTDGNFLYTEASNGECVYPNSFDWIVQDKNGSTFVMSDEKFCQKYEPEYYPES